MKQKYVRKKGYYITFKKIKQEKERKGKKKGGESILSRINGHGKEEKEIEKPCSKRGAPFRGRSSFQKLLATILPMKDPLHPFST